MSTVDQSHNDGLINTIVGIVGTMIVTGIGMAVGGIRWLIGIGHDVSVLKLARAESDKREADRAAAIDNKFEHMSQEMRTAVTELRHVSQGTHESVIRLETKMDLLIDKKP